MAGKKRILQIIPAQGWLAMFRNRETGNIETEPIPCWALVEEENGDRSVVGMDADSTLDFAEDMGNFVGYIHESQAKSKEE